MTSPHQPSPSELKHPILDGSQHPSLDWFQRAAFGMFIHWGLYAIPAGRWKGAEIPSIGEWIMRNARIPVEEYSALAGQFNPVNFDPAEWVALAKRAGQRYMVLTAKHHDGFCLWATQQTDYNVVDATPFGRDIVGELAEECQKQRLPFGVYYSQTQDWHHPDGDGNDWDYDEDAKDFDGYIEHYVKPQVRELLTSYGPLCLIWFDTPRRISVAQSEQLRCLVHELQPECLVNGRVGNGQGDYGEAGDNAIPQNRMEGPWETPVTMNNTWGYKVSDHEWKPVELLQQTLTEVSAKGGNTLLNVGPDASGRIPPESVSTLNALGEWLAGPGRSVYRDTAA